MRAISVRRRSLAVGGVLAVLLVMPSIAQTPAVAGRLRTLGLLPARSDVTELYFSGDSTSTNLVNADGDVAFYFVAHHAGPGERAYTWLATSSPHRTAGVTERGSFVLRSGDFRTVKVSRLAVSCSVRSKVAVVLSDQLGNAQEIHFWVEARGVTDPAGGAHCG